MYIVFGKGHFFELFANFGFFFQPRCLAVAFSETFFDENRLFWTFCWPKIVIFAKKRKKIELFFRIFPFFFFLGPAGPGDLTSGFNLSGGCFGTDIVQKWTKWSQIGLHGLKFGQIFAKCQCALFLLRQMHKKLKHIFRNSNIIKCHKKQLYILRL